VIVDAKTTALISVFAVLAIVLNPAISGVGLPYPLLPGLYFEIWEIPIIAAFLLFGVKVALASELLNVVFLFAVFPGPSQPYYTTNVIAVTGMILGVYMATMFVARNTSDEKPVSKAKLIRVSVALAIVFRVVFMALVMFSILYFDPVGVYPPIPVNYIVATVLPLQAIFNVILPIYMIPTSFLIAKTVSKNLKIGNKIV
jgi:hypothetical protein